MILKANQIANRMTSVADEHVGDPLVIAPFPNIEELKKSGAASIDLRLGTWFATMRQSRIPVLEVDDELSKAADRANLSAEQRKVIEEFLPSATSPSEANLTRSYYVSFGSRFILHPRNFVLGVTLEWIRLP